MTSAGESTGIPPWRAEDISVEWLNDVLGKHPDFRDAKIASFDMDMISEGSGFVGEVLRITFNYENRTSSTPESIAAKFANRDPRIKAHASALTVKEANVYHHLGPDSEFIMPKCYFSDSEPETGDCAILIEDLGRGRFGDNTGGISEYDAKAAARAIAVFHAKWWGRTDQKRTRWLPTQIDQAAFLKERFTRSAPIFLERFGERVDNEYKEITSLYLEKLIPILEAASSPPLTIVHGDFRPDNIVFDTGFRGCPITAIDWQLTTQGNGALDISYLATFGLTVDLRRAIEDSLLSVYHTTLVSEGVTGYSLNQCQTDYKTGILYPFRVSVQALANLDLSDERGQVLAQAVLDRTSAALRDHDIAVLLREM